MDFFDALRRVMRVDLRKHESGILLAIENGDPNMLMHHAGGLHLAYSGYEMAAETPGCDIKRPRKRIPRELAKTAAKLGKLIQGPVNYRRVDRLLEKILGVTDMDADAA
jgi:hypothetical protein